MAKQEETQEESESSIVAELNLGHSASPLVFRVSGSVIDRIWRPVILVILWTIFVVTCYMSIEQFQYKWKPTLIQLMGVVCGLLLAFRSNSAYDRYWEGRKYWSTMTQGIRTLTRVIWVYVKEENAADIVEKKSAINLLIAFAIATKHYLREEYDYDYEDFAGLTTHVEWQSESAHAQKKNRQQSIDSTASASASVKRVHSVKAHDVPTPTNIPVELSFHIASYINSIRERGKCDGGTIGVMNGALSSLMECLTGLERILRTPIPLAYSIHLHQSIWIYILALPFQLVTENHWWTILIVGITTFFLLGILAIGWEIENPFGYDDNDLPLDDYCAVLRREIEMIIAHRVKKSEEIVFKANNKPFGPECSLNAIELSKKSVLEINAILANCARKSLTGSTLALGPNSQKSNLRKKLE